MPKRVKNINKLQTNAKQNKKVPIIRKNEWQMPKTSTNHQKTCKYGKCQNVPKCHEMRKTLKFENIEENGTGFGSVCGHFWLFVDVLDDLGTVVAI